MAGRKPDPFTAEGASQIAAELERYTKQGSNREQRRRYLAQWVSVLAAKQCSISEIVRVLRTVGVKTTRETVSALIQQGGPAASGMAQPPPLPPPLPRKESAPALVSPQVGGQSAKPPTQRPHSGLRNVKL